MTANIGQWVKSLATPGKPDELEVKQLLASAGVAVPRGVRLAAGAAVKPPDFPAPWVVKVCSGEILHKTEHGGVMLNVTPANLAETVARLRELFPKTALLIEEQVKFASTECIIGAMVDPEFGPAVMVGAGGVLTELYQDVAFRLAPCSTTEARSMLSELKIAPVFAGFRGMDLDPEGLARVVSVAGELALGLGNEFSQLDINPLGFSQGKWIALDAKLVMKGSTHDGH